MFALKVDFAEQKTEEVLSHFEVISYVKVMTTSRAGGLHKPPWGIPHTEPLGSSNNPPLAVVALPPQMWQLSLSLPCVKGGGTACRDGRIVLSFFYTSTIPQSASLTAPFTQGSLRCGGNCAKLKLFVTTSTAGGFREQISFEHR